MSRVAATDDARSEFTDKLGPACLLLGRLIRRRIEQALDAAGLGLTPAQARVLVMLHLHGPQTQHALAGLTEVEPSTLVSTLDVLEREGLARRGANPQDRRAYLVALTAKGGRQVPKLFALWDGIEHELGGAFTARERDALLGSLQRLIAHLSASDGDSACCG